MNIKSLGWNTKIDIDNMTLLELQMLYDAIGCFSYADAILIWDDKERKVPYTKEKLNELFYYLKENISKVGGKE